MADFPTDRLGAHSIVASVQGIILESWNLRKILLRSADSSCCFRIPRNAKFWRRREGQASSFRSCEGRRRSRWGRSRRRSRRSEPRCRCKIGDILGKIQMIQNCNIRQHCIQKLHWLSITCHYNLHAILLNSIHEWGRPVKLQHFDALRERGWMPMRFSWENRFKFCHCQ